MRTRTEPACLPDPSRGALCLSRYALGVPLLRAISYQESKTAIETRKIPNATALLDTARTERDAKQTELDTPKVELEERKKKAQGQTSKRASTRQLSAGPSKRARTGGSPTDNSATEALELLIAKGRLREG
ncbi:hypothetical protein PG993_002365 [Apiospora rasikravindrae]|uniref:Uncharacterized protein n=1 Tax=Apiospora rasikravindrae TaxID=990691 RepID=A0ABR1TWF5_9PEZI